MPDINVSFVFHANSMLKRNYFISIKSGRAWNGAHRDAGKVTHLVRIPASGRFDDSCWDAAICGAKPGGRSNGWTKAPKEIEIITCEKCKAKIRRLLRDAPLLF